MRRPSSCASGARTICFIKSRKGVELVAKLVADQLERRGTRARRPRRALPRRLHAAAAPRARGAGWSRGDLLAVVTTDALELGIDIGALDAAVVVTFPGTVASLRQMWGRAGRRGRGLAVYVAGEDALDQFFCRHPDEFLDRPVEAAILDHENEEIHDPHLLCAAHEGPLDPDADAEFLGPRRARALRAPRRRAASCVERAGTSRCAAPRTTRPRACRCARARPTRSRWSTSATARCSAPSRPRARSRPSTTARSTCTWGAPTRSASSTSTARRALVEPFDGDWYTQPKKETDTYDRAAAGPPRDAGRDAELRDRHA